MDFIRRFIEQKISTATGADVRLGKLSFSPISGVVEVRDLSVGTFLTVRKIEGRIAVGRALKQEIVVRSLTIEGPAFTVKRSADGKLNLPPRPPPRKDAAGPKEPGKSWEFEAHKVLLLDGRIGFADESGYQLSLEKLNGSIERKSAAETEFIFAADSLGRRDRAVDLGEARVLGKLAGALEISLTAGTILNLNLRTASMDSGLWEGEMTLTLALTTLLALLPSTLAMPIKTAIGDARLSAAGVFDLNNATLRLRQFELRTGPVTLG